MNIVLILLLVTMMSAAEPLPVPKPPGQQCPARFASGAHWCTPMPGSTRDAVVKGQGHPHGPRQHARGAGRGGAAR
jgi:hypothetical protein